MSDVQPVQAYKVLIHIPQTRLIEISLPTDAPAGPAEVVVLIPRGDAPSVIPWPWGQRLPEVAAAVPLSATDAPPPLAGIAG
ncbi:MAG: hypothetical protein IT372_32045 [Polyangiaceae bacterium]|nr:hypothetical protein [Polyangiaceae bacterium]